MTSKPRIEALTRVPPGTRVLCVDDESMIGELVADVLRSQLRCHVRSARNGEEALVALAEEEFDVIVVDYVMPKMNGGELFRHLEANRPELLPRVMFITGDVLSEATLGHIGSTGRPLLEKPFGLPELTTSILGLLAGQREGGISSTVPEA
jgi:CheY-like chemotaxis protein